MVVKPLSGLTGPLRGLLITSLVATIAAVFSDLYTYVQYSALPAGTSYDETFLESDGLNGIVGFAQFVFGLAAFVLFLMWLHRANRNLRALAGETLTITPGWAVGWFFIPLASLWMPYMAVKEVWRASHRHTGRGAALVGWWWAAMLANVAATISAASVGGDPVDARDTAAAAIGWEVADGVLAIMYVVTLLLVGAIAGAYAKRVVEPPAGTVVTETPGAASAWSGAATPAAGLGSATSPGADLMTGVSAVPAMGGTGGMVPVGRGAQSAAGGAPADFAAAAPVVSAIPAVPAAWYPDPAARHELRWWDGAQWTAHVADGGAQSQDPI